MTKPPPHLGLHHVAIFVRDLAAARRFWVDLLGFRVEWEPDADNLYLTSGTDNVALHHATGEPGPAQRLDHVGILAAGPADVDAWCAHLRAHGAAILAEPKRHRDGAYSFTCADPDGIHVQVIHHPPITPALMAARR